MKLLFWLNKSKANKSGNAPVMMESPFQENFMCNAGMESYGLGDLQRATAMEYFIQCGYGQKCYTPEDMRKMMKELESISGLFPYNSKTKLIDLHSSWRKEYFKFWFRKWFRKYRRNK